MLTMSFMKIYIAANIIKLTVVFGFGLFLVHFNKGMSSVQMNRKERSALFLCLIASLVFYLSLLCDGRIAKKSSLA